MVKSSYVQLREVDRAKLQDLFKRGDVRARTLTRALALLAYDRGEPHTQVIKTTGLTYGSLRRLVLLYPKEGLACLYDKPRSGRPVEFNQELQDRVLVLACEEAPKGYSQWSVRLLADRVVELNYINHISHTSIANILAKKKLKPHLTKTWCIGQITAVFIALMERLLWLYRQPYDAARPVVCFDERPCYLIGEVAEDLAMDADFPRRQDYEYTKNGSCNLLLAVEPLTGKRVARVYKQRRGIEYAEFMQIVSQTWSDAETIQLVQDNLNTHSASSFYHHMEAQKAQQLDRRFNFFYTPKKGSWLNAVEIDFSAIARACLNRRIATQEELTEQVYAQVAIRNDNAVKINWNFDLTAARRTFNSHYNRINPLNQVITET